MFAASSSLSVSDCCCAHSAPARRCEYARGSKHIVKNRKKSTEETGDSVLPVILNLSSVFKVVGFLSEQRIYVFMSSFVF